MIDKIDKGIKEYLFYGLASLVSFFIYNFYMDTKQLPDVLKAIEQNTAITANTMSLKFIEYDKINDRQDKNIAKNDDNIKKLNEVAFSNVKEIEILKSKAGIFK